MISFFGLFRLVLGHVSVLPLLLGASSSSKQVVGHSRALPQFGLRQAAFLAGGPPLASRLADGLSPAAQSSDTLAQQTHLPGQHQSGHNQDRTGYDQSAHQQEDRKTTLVKQLPTCGLLSARWGGAVGGGEGRLAHCGNRLDCGGSQHLGWRWCIRRGLIAFRRLTVCYVNLNYARQDGGQEEAKHCDLWGDGRRQWIWKKERHFIYPTTGKSAQQTGQQIVSVPVKILKPCQGRMICRHLFCIQSRRARVEQRYFHMKMLMLHVRNVTRRAD